MNVPKITERKVSYQEYLEGTLIPDIHKMQHEHLDYLSFAVIGTSIEVLGAFFDAKPLGEDGLSKSRFKTAIEKLFIPLNSRYQVHCPCKKNKHHDHCLYRGLRCGMAHIGRPQGKIVFTTKLEAQADGNTHLGPDPQGLLILVAEELADDFGKAWTALKEQSAEGKTVKKVTDPYLTVYKYENPSAKPKACEITGLPAG
jgi:hypothetical protein